VVFVAEREPRSDLRRLAERLTEWVRDPLGAVLARELPADANLDRLFPGEKRVVHLLWPDAEPGAWHAEPAALAARELGAWARVQERCLVLLGLKVAQAFGGGELFDLRMGDVPMLILPHPSRVANAHRSRRAVTTFLANFGA
jgi:hypothetical protein